MELSAWMPISIILTFAGLTKLKDHLWIFIFALTLFTGAAAINIYSPPIGVHPLHILLPILAFLVYSSRTLSNNWKLPKPSTSIMLLVLFSIISTISSISSTKIQIGQLLYIFFLPATAYTMYATTRYLPFHRITQGICTAFLVVSTFSVVKLILDLLQIPSGSEFFVNSISVANNTWATAFGIPRAHSIFPEPSYLGVYAAVMAVFIISLIVFGANINKSKKHLALLAALSIITMLLSGSTTGIGTFLLGSGYILAISLISGKKSSIIKTVSKLAAITITIASSIGLLFIALPELSNIFTNWFLMRLEFSDASSLERLGGTQEGYKILFERPLLGIGPGNFVSADLFSTVAGSTGLLGVLCLSGAFLSIIVRGTLQAIKFHNPSTLPYTAAMWSIGMAYLTGLGHYSHLWTWALLGITSNILENATNKNTVRHINE